MFDSHCHWDHPRLQALQPSLWQSCLQQQVQALLVPGTQAQQWPAQIALCQQQPSWHLALGLHPYFVAQHQLEHLLQLKKLIGQHAPVAVGEIGLDWHMPESTWAMQETYFTQQLTMARDCDLPIIVHVRKCHDKVIKLLRQHKFTEGGIIHAYSGNAMQAKAYGDLGFKLGVGGTITYARASKTRALMAQIPMDYLVLETDAPDMPMAHQQDRLNRPDHLPYVAEALAALRQLPVQQVIDITYANTLQALRLAAG